MLMQRLLAGDARHVCALGKPIHAKQHEHADVDLIITPTMQTFPRPAALWLLEALYHRRITMQRCWEDMAAALTCRRLEQVWLRPAVSASRPAWLAAIGSAAAAERSRLGSWQHRLVVSMEAGRGIAAALRSVGGAGRLERLL